MLTTRNIVALLLTSRRWPAGGERRKGASGAIAGAKEGASTKARVFYFPKQEELVARQDCKLRVDTDGAAASFLKFLESHRASFAWNGNQTENVL